MSANENGDPQLRDPASVSLWPGEQATAPAKPHFDTFETHFFQQGDDSSGLPGAGDVFDEIDSRRRGRPLVSRGTLAGLTIASSTLAVVACWALARSNAVAPAPPAPVHIAKTTPVAVPVAAPAPAVVPLAAAALPEKQAGEADPGKAAVAEALAPTAKTGVAEVPAPSVAQAEPAAAAPSAAPVAAPVAPAADKSDPPAPINASDGDVQKRCRDAIRSGRGRAILGACPAAFAESADAETAVALAKAELDRGHFSQAYSWSQKAIAINPASADAYVFAGGAEQNQGHGKAAKEAYLHYLRLAPSGRYAAEIRSIVRSL